jgi:hypothetical protein
MEALEQFGIFEGIEADGTGQLVLKFLQGLIGNRLRLSHRKLNLNIHRTEEQVNQKLSVTPQPRFQRDGQSENLLNGHIY